jgi:hypothetical protein
MGGAGGILQFSQVVGGKLAVWSEVDSGTELELRIPLVSGACVLAATLAYSAVSTPTNTETGSLATK